MSPYGKGKGSLWGLFIRISIQSGGLHPHHFITYQGPHHSTGGGGGVRIPTWGFWRDINTQFITMAYPCWLQCPLAEVVRLFSCLHMWNGTSSFLEAVLSLHTHFQAPTAQSQFLFYRKKYLATIISANHIHLHTSHPLTFSACLLCVSWESHFPFLWKKLAGGILGLGDQRWRFLPLISYSTL